jgi:hypothetical protein
MKPENQPTNPPLIVLITQKTQSPELAATVRALSSRLNRSHEDALR